MKSFLVAAQIWFVAAGSRGRGSADRYCILGNGPSVWILSDLEPRYFLAQYGDWLAQYGD